MLTATPTPSVLFHPSSPPPPRQPLNLSFRRTFCFHNFRGGTVSVLRRQGIGHGGVEGLAAAQRGPWEQGSTARPGTTPPHPPPFPLPFHNTHAHTKLSSPAYGVSAHLTAAVFKSLLRRKLRGLNLRPAISLLSRALLL